MARSVIYPRSHYPINLLTRSPSARSRQRHYPPSHQLNYSPTLLRTHSHPHIQSLTRPVACTLIFPDVRFFTEPMSFNEHHNTAFHSQAHTHAHARTHTHTHTNIHSITHLSTNVLHRTLLPNKQTGRRNKPRINKMQQLDVYINFCLNMFRASLCPSSGEQMPCYCIWCVVLTSCKTAPHNRYQPHPAEPEQYTKCSNWTFVLLKMGIMMPETC